MLANRNYNCEKPDVERGKGKVVVVGGGMRELPREVFDLLNSRSKAIHKDSRHPKGPNNATYL